MRILAASCRLSVTVSPEDNLVKVTVNDNGKGFDPSTLEESNGVGLKLIRERVEMLGGYMEIESALGQGCKVTFQVPSLDIENAIK